MHGMRESVSEEVHRRRPRKSRRSRIRETRDKRDKGRFFVPFLFIFFVKKEEIMD